MKVGLYFGSFNPVHTGHCIIAAHVVNYTELKQVWMVVSPLNPFKVSSSLLNEYHRLHLVQLALEEESTLKASDIEFHLPRPSYTIDTLTYLDEKYPQHTFSVIMGSDSYQNLARWKNAHVIMERYNVYVYTRPGFPVVEPAQPNIHVLSAPFLDISSTRIRESIRMKKSISFLVPGKVKDEIERNGYYK